MFKCIDHIQHLSVQPVMYKPFESFMEGLHILNGNYIDQQLFADLN